MNEGNEQKDELFKIMAQRRLSSVRSIEEFILELRKQKYIEISIKRLNIFTLFISLSLRQICSPSTTRNFRVVFGKQIYDKDLSAYGIDTHNSVKNALNANYSFTDTYQKPHSFSVLTRLSSATSDFVNKNRMKKFLFCLFPSGEAINVGERQHSLVLYTFKPTIHPIEKELDAAKILHYPPVS